MKSLLHTIIGLLLIHCSSCTSDENLIVQTEYGRIQGIQENTTKGTPFYSFLSIPYAKPPLGNLRFREAVQPEKWTELLATDTQPVYCNQFHLFDLMVGKRKSFGQEDCLYLNVYTKRPNDVHANLPVLFYIHGGGFFSGGAREYRPYFLLEDDFVMVVPNYRLNIFGFLSTEDSVMPGNLGLKDQNFAMQWVQRNIRQFGGDPNRVTIVGQSAGGASVHAHIMSPKSKGLFHQAIAQSGSTLCPWALNPIHRQFAKTMGDSLNCTLEAGKSEAFRTCLQGKDASSILETFPSMMDLQIMPLRMIPRVDGDFIPDEPATLLKEGRFNKVPLISGTTLDEGAFLSMTMYSSPKYYDGMANNLEATAPLAFMLVGEEDGVNVAKAIYDHYLKGKKVSYAVAKEVTQLFGDLSFKVDQEVAAAYFLRNMDVYRYSFDHLGQHSLMDLYDIEPAKNYVSHCDDILYLFNGGELFTNPLETKEDLLVRDILVKMWANFVIHGNPTPNMDLGFKWKKSTSANFDLLSITTKPKMIKDQNQETRKFYNSLNTRQNKLLFPDGNTTILEEENTKMAGEL